MQTWNSGQFPAVMFQRRTCLRVWEKTSLDHDFDCFLSQFKTALVDSLTNSRSWCIMCRPLLSC
jgi:hypothetical protein